MRPTQRLLLVAIVILAAVVRVTAGASSSVYVDEAYTFFISRAPLPEIVTGARTEFNTPLYYAILHPLARLTSAPISLRLPSILAGVVAVVALYVAGRREGEEGPALLAAALTAAAYEVWLSDAQIRGYGLLGLGVVLLVLQSSRAAEDQLPWGLPVYLATCVVVASLHYLGSAVCAGLAVAMLVLRRPRLAACHALALLLPAAWMLYASSGVATELKSRMVAPQFPLLHFPSYLTGGLLPLAARPVTPAVAIPVDLLLWTAVGAGGVRLWSRRRTLLLPVVASILAPMLLLLAGNSTGVQSYQHRYLVPEAGLFFLLLAYGLPPRLRLPLGGLLLAINLVVAALFPRHSWFWHQDWRRVAAFVGSRATREDVICGYAAYDMVGFNFYYRPRSFDVDFSEPGYPLFRFAADYDGAEQIPLYVPDLGPDLETHLGRRRVFLVLSQDDAAGGGPAVRQWFAARYRLADSLETATFQSWGHITVYVLQPRGA